MKKTLNILALVLAIPLGAVMFVYAEIDDSPGGQLIGLIVGLVGIVGLYKMWKKR